MKSVYNTLRLRNSSCCRPELLTLRCAIRAECSSGNRARSRTRCGYRRSAEERFSASTAYISLHFYALRRSASRAAIPHNDASLAWLPRARLVASLKSILKPTSRRQGHVRCHKRPCAALSADTVWTTQLEESSGRVAKGFDKCSGLIRTSRVRPTSLQQMSHTAGA